MLARGALCRLAAEVPKHATRDLPKLASLVQAARAAYALPLRPLAHAAQLQVRSYATAEPAATVKKAVKAKAGARKSVKTTTAKKPAAKKPAKKAAPKKAKKKAAAKKPARKASKPRKVLTDEDKEKRAITKLRSLALREPFKRRPMSAYNVYVQDNVKNAGDAGGQAELTRLARAWKEVTPAELEKYNHLAAERTEARSAEYKAWVQSHTPEQIRIANNARAQLRRKFAGKLKRTHPDHTQTILDDRAVKRARTPWIVFFSERIASADFKNIAVPDKAKLISGEWKALSAGEKQRFEDEAAADKQRNIREKAALAKA